MSVKYVFNPFTGNFDAIDDGANRSLSNLTSPTAINQNLLPNVDLTLTLGDVTHRWQTLFVSRVTQNGVNGINVSSNLLLDSSGNASLNYSTRELVNPTGVIIAAWNSTFLDLNSHLISNVLDPVSAQDAATKNYVDTATGNFANKSLSNLTSPTSINQNLLPQTDSATDLGSAGFSWRDLYLVNIKRHSTGTLAYNVTTSEFVDTSGKTAIAFNSRILLNTAGTTTMLDWSGTDVSLNTHKLTNVVDPTAAQDAATKNYVDTANAGFANTSLSNLANPTAINRTLQANSTNTFNIGTSSVYWQQGFFHLLRQDNVTAYIELGPSAALRDLSANTSVDWQNRQLASGATVKLDWSGTNIDVNTRKIINVVDPTNPQDAATKAYVDAQGTIPPTTQTLSSVSGTTYTTPANVKWLRVSMVAGGGGGAGSGALVTPGTNGGNGSDTTFGTSLLSCQGGLGGLADGTGGDSGSSNTISSPAYGFNPPGNPGGTGSLAALSAGSSPGGMGGGSFWGGAGKAGDGGSGIAATAGFINTGGGGGGGSPSGAGLSYAGGGGGSGGYIEAIVPTPSATYSYAIGAGGSAGSGGAGGNTGAAGGSGVIIVEEYY